MNNIITQMLVSAPNDLWSNLIHSLQGVLGNYGWAILLLTIFVKLIVSPLDFFVKYSTKKQTLIQQKCAPQIAKLNKKFGKDQNALRIQQQSLYKREGLNLGSGCIIMLVNMVLTMVIFFTFYSSLRKVSAYEAIKQYENLSTTFTQTQTDLLIENNNELNLDYDITDAESAEKFLKEWKTASEISKKLGEGIEKDEIELADGDTNTVDYYISLYANNESNIDLFNQIDSKVKNAVLDKWNNEVKANWLWVDNIWVADAPINAFPDYDSMYNLAKNGGYENDAKAINKTQFNTICNIIGEDQNYKANGYYVLAILAGVITFLQQYISELHTKLKNKKANKVAKTAGDASNSSSMKILKIILPIIMVVFVLTSTATFGIYILASNIISIITGEISSIIINALTKKKQQEVEEVLEKEANRLIKKGQMEG